VLSHLEANGIAYRRELQDGVELLHVAASPSLPQELSPGISVAIGASTEHRSLHLAHPLAVAAIEAARAPDSCLSARVELPSAAPPDLDTHRGKHARLRLVKLAANGFERVELLLPVVVLETGEMLEPALAEVLLRGTFTAKPPGNELELDEHVLQDAVEEAVFGLRTSLDQAEHARFERALQQAERFIEDRLLVQKARRAKQRVRLQEAERRRESATGSEARSEADLAVLKVQDTLEEIEARITRLTERDDKTFRAYREHINARRYAPPSVTTLFDVELVIA
jgi:hypothetical protein